MILVTAANGNQGKLLLPKLLAAGEPVRVVVKTDQSAAALLSRGADEAVVGDLGDARVRASVLEGVRAVYHVGPTLHPLEREMGIGLVDAATSAGVEHFVFSSVLHSIVTDLVQHEIKRDIEEHLLASDLEFTILQPSNYMLPLKLRPAFERGVFELSWALERRQSLVDLDDVTTVVAKVLKYPEQHVGATYELVGLGRYTADDLRAVIERVTGRPIGLRQINADEYASAWLGGRDPSTASHELSVLRSISARYSAHDFIGNSNVLTWLLGREPKGFESFVRREWDSYQGSRR
ncbi:nucleoside-diphosphate sugar epimerase [Cryobacterium adonitolivorans]|uniref:Nucleoside-diphosphate sugar epimerase n=1 Tax=Cryobacterium adonitolivorans TaxID=1259189 RepID=A0A4R8W265_9MICO|nr:NmrA family NAD(P)-binding protein [Cryobacterium adonitolivorans]TFC01070.1 nucleoside-diphosphate sugar epimerase [Cryobacterium adonitolivorans]